MISFQPSLIDYEMDEEIISETAQQHSLEDMIPIDQHGASHIFPTTTLPEPQAQADETHDSPFQAPADRPLPVLPASSLSLHPQAAADDPDQGGLEHQEVFELFHDALDSERLVVDGDHDDMLTVISTSINEAADALYSSLRLLFSTGKAEPPLPFSTTSICNLDIKALDRTKISANM
jgi:hypothetical protein